MRKSYNLAVGKIGENVACRYLTSQGYKIIDRNFHKGYSEIDIVAMEKDTIVFVEVKTRKGNLFGQAEEAITPWKLKALIRAAYYYKLCHPQLLSAMRIDVLSVYLNSDNATEKINLIKNITL